MARSVESVEDGSGVNGGVEKVGRSKTNARIVFADNFRSLFVRVLSRMNLKFFLLVSGAEEKSIVVFDACLVFGCKSFIRVCLFCERSEFLLSFVFVVVAVWFFVVAVWN